MKLKNAFHLSLLALFMFLVQTVHAQTFSVIHAFNGADGSAPHAGVTLKDGVLYGTFFGPSGGVYEITRRGNSWAATPIYLFSGNDGAGPQARVVFGPDGHLYGTTSGGGAHNGGTVFRLVPNPTVCPVSKCFLFKEDAHYSFNQGEWPLYATVTFDQAGNAYGTTWVGGENGQGSVYQVQTSGNNWTGMPIHSFGGQPDGRLPWGGLFRDSKGNLFGTTFLGGANDWGSVFELTYIEGVGWQETVLYSFQGTTDGLEPVGDLVSDASGNLYGSTTQGGSPIGGGGTIFELSPSGNSWTFKTIYALAGDGGCGPLGALGMDAAGNLYGTSRCNGAHNQGNVFKMSNTGNGWSYTSLYDFTGGSDGGMPYSNVTVDTDGTLYGTASQGGSVAGFCPPNGCGVVWMIKP